MSEMGCWLENLGLGQLASTFAGAAIDLDILPEITEDDLEKLGIPLREREVLLGVEGDAQEVASFDRVPASRKSRAVLRRRPPARSAPLRSGR